MRTGGPELKIVSVSGLRLAVWDWPGDDPPVLFAHATGHHGRCWDEAVRAIEGRHCIAVDFRGHGRSAKPAPPYHWDAFGCDLAAIVDEMKIRDAVGVGHSMGGHSVVHAAILHPDAFRALLLLDPTIYAPERYGKPGVKVDFIRRRRNHYQTTGEMFDRFRAKPPFESWNERVLRDYCEYGLMRDAAGLVLACPPEIEASVYEHSNEPEANLHYGIPRIEQEVTIWRAAGEFIPGTFNLSASPTAPDLASRFRRGRDVLLEGRDHFFPQQSPEMIAREITGRPGCR